MSAAELGLVLTEERVVVSSRDVAKIFEKDHDKVIRTIRNLECSSVFSQANFGLAEYKDEQNKPRPHYFITRDGFTLLGMGFTGKKAMQFKEAYITAFNEMERAIRVKRCPIESLPAERVFLWKDTREAVSTGHYVRPLVNDFVSYCCETVGPVNSFAQNIFRLVKPA